MPVAYCCVTHRHRKRRELTFQKILPPDGYCPIIHPKNRYYVNKVLQAGPLTGKTVKQHVLLVNGFKPEGAACFGNGTG